VICERLVPILLRHVDDFMVGSDGCKSDVDKVSAVLSHLGDRIHPAATSRQTELEYLKAVSRTLLEVALNPQELQCRYNILCRTLTVLSKRILRDHMIKEQYL